MTDTHTTPTPTEMPEELKAFAKTPRGKRASAFSQQLLDVLVPEIDKHVLAEIERAIAPLRAELEALRAQQLKYQGTWRAERSYAQGSIVTHAGSAWHANKLTAQKPGASSDWTMMIKSGRDVR